MRQLAVILGTLASVGAAHAEPKRTPEECKQEAAAIGAFLAKTPHDTHPLLRAKGFAHARRDDLVTPVPPAPILQLGPSGTTVQGQRATTRGELAKLVASTKRGTRVLLLIEQTVAWSRVVEVLEVVWAAKLVPVFVFEAAVAIERPPRSAYDDAIAKAKASNGRASYADALTAVIAPCPPLGKLLDSLRGEGVDRTQAVLDGIAPALTACACSADLPSVRSLGWDLVAERRTVVSLAFEGPPTETLVLPGDALWGLASKQLISGKSYTFAVK